MRILFLSHYFPPEVNAPAVRTFEHCREWVRAGHEVHVITCVPNHPQGKVYDGYRRSLATQREETDGIHVHRVWTYVAANRGFLKRTLGYVSYMLSASLAALKVSRPDVIVATSPQFFCACAGLLTSKLLRRPWVFEVRDLWPATIIAVGAVPEGRLTRALEALEMYLYRSADRVVLVTDGFRKVLRERGIEPARLAVIQNGVDLVEFDRMRSASPVRRELGLDGKFLVSYVGTHGMCQGLQTVLESARQLTSQPDVHFLFVGEGAEKGKLVRLEEQWRLPNVSFLPQQPRHRVPDLLRTSDVCLVPLRKSDVFTTVIPSKVFEIMAAGTPMVISVDGEARSLVEEAGAGRFVPPEDDAAMARAIEQLRAAPEERDRLGRAGRRYVEQFMDRRRLARGYEQLLRRLMWSVLREGHLRCAYSS